MRLIRICSALVAALGLLAGCTVGPRYTKPEAPMSAAFKENADWKRAEPADDIPRGRWWTVFADPQLSALCERVNISNQTVQIAEAQLRQVEALSRQARAALFPIVTGNAGATRSRPAAVPNRPANGVFNSYSMSAATSWELDLWGRVRNAIDVTQANAQASTADLESARLSAQATLAQSYFLLRITDAQRQLLEDTIAAYARSLELTRNRYNAGVAAKVEVVQAETQLKSTQAQAIDLGVQRAQLEHAIAILVGEAPANFSIPRAPVAPVIAAGFKIPVIPVGLPSSLLERRPDIAGAERRVAAANAQIGVTEAAFFPAFTINATGGMQSSVFSRLLEWPNHFWSIGPAVAQALFDGGLRRAQNDAARAAHEATVAQYRQTVLGGLAEVEDNLAALRILEEEARVQDEAVRAGREAVELTLNQYKAGVVSFLSVITVQTAALANERTAVTLLGRRLTAAVTLVKAIGGGWRATELAREGGAPDYSEVGN